MDKLVVSLRDYINGAGPPVDQTETFYRFRDPGVDFLAPFSVNNVNTCSGKASEIPGVEPIDYWVVAIDEVKHVDDEYEGDRTLFLTYDFSKLNIMAEVLADPLYVGEKGKQRLHKYRYIKKQC